MNIFYNAALLLSFPLLFSCKQATEKPQPSPAPGNLPKQQTGTARIVFTSADGGQTWQDISKGLPENFTPGKSGISARNYWGIHVIKTNGTSVWSPVLEIFREPRIRSTFETAGGNIFIGTDRGFLKTVNNGKTWKLIHTGGLTGHLAELEGVLVAISGGKIIRSTDDGESWGAVSSEDSVAWDVKQMKGGLVAITSGSASDTRRLSTSYDGGKTWHRMDAGLQNKAFIDLIWHTWNDRPLLQAFATSIIQVGDNFFCTHPYGIFKSSDKGKTWKLLLPAPKEKVFNLFVSGNVLYAIGGRGGC